MAPFDFKPESGYIQHRNGETTMADLLNIRYFSILAAVIVVLAGPVSAFGQGTRPPADSNGTIVAVYAIQVGAVSVMDNAQKLVATLKAKGFEAVIYDNLIDGKQLLHLVWVGRFDSPQDAIVEIRRIEELTGIRGVLREQMIWRKKN
jgi:hypothetical protein